MSKITINNEIILLRQYVDQAKIHIIKKLSRSAFKLRTKKGTEQQKAQNLRKADKIASEILSIKKIKRDEITKFALTNTLNLLQILQDQKSEPLTRIMARIANHKRFRTIISEFKSKYPNYMEFLGPGRKKKAKLEQKEKRKLKNVNIENDESHSSNKMEDTSNTEVLQSNDESSVDESDVNEDDVSENDESLHSTKEEQSNENATKEKVKSIKLKKENINVEDIVKQENESEDSDNQDKKSIKSKILETDIKLVLKDTVKQETESDHSNENEKNIQIVNPAMMVNTAKKEKSKNLLGKRKKEHKEKEPTTSTNVKPEIKKKKADTSKVISNQAIVKKFNDILKEEDSKPEIKVEINTEAEKSNLKIEKEIDSFFFSGDGDQNYLSVALPKNKLNEEEEEYGNTRFNKKKFSLQQNDKFFSKISQFQNNDSNYNSNNQDSRWKGQRNNERPFGRDRQGSNFGFNKFNDKSNGRFHDKSNNRFNDKANDRFNDKFNDRQKNKFNNERKGNAKPFKKQDKDNFESNSNETLHPSWEAKKKQQDLIKKGFQGKKIVFGDDV